MEKLNEVTCESCGRPFMATLKRYYCDHCDRYFHVCPTCGSDLPKCRFCGIPLKKKNESRIIRTRIRSAARV